MRISKTLIYSIILGTLYITSANDILIGVMGFRFNPSKLIMLGLMPLAVLALPGNLKLKNTDILFLGFIVLIITKAVLIKNFSYLTSITNFVFPFLVYKYFQSNLKHLSIKILVFSILFIAVLNSSLGLAQFFTGDKGLVLIESSHSFKLHYARQYSYNPFLNLLLLPQGLYGYSNVLAISLIFPSYVLFGYKKFLNPLVSSLLFALFGFTIFITFARTEALAFLLLLMIFLLAIRKNKIHFGKLALGVGIIAVLALGYLLTAGDATGTIMVRNPAKYSGLFNSWDKILLGGDILKFREEHHTNPPHNIFLYSWYAYGLLAALSIIGYFALSYLNYLKFYFEKVRLASSKHEGVFIFLILFYFYALFIRGWAYYIFDGYESIFLLFFLMLLLETTIHQYKKASFE